MIVLVTKVERKTLIAFFYQKKKRKIQKVRLLLFQSMIPKIMKIYHYRIFGKTYGTQILNGKVL
jgi:hypothetical protein